MIFFIEDQDVKKEKSRIVNTAYDIRNNRQDDMLSDDIDTIKLCYLFIYEFFIFYVMNNEHNFESTSQE